MLTFLLLLFLASLSLVYNLLSRFKKNEPHFCPPPGPKGLPFFGNLHQFDFSAPHVYLAKLAKTYGPIVHLRFGYTPVVVVQSAKTAEEVLKIQDLNFCSRPRTIGLQRLSYNGLDIAVCPYNEYFREMKKISVIHLFNSKRVQSFVPIRQEEVSRLIKNISFHCSTNEIVNLSELVSSFACSNISRIAFGKRYEENTESRRRLRHLIDEAEALFIGFFFTDYFPTIGWLDKLTGQSARLENTFKELDAFYDNIIKDHLDPEGLKSDREDIIDVLLHQQKERSFAFELTLDHVKAILMNILIAGTDTSSTMIIWVITELIKNTSAMKKVQDELRNNATLSRGYMVEDDLRKLEYFKAVVKETFRLHPAAPLLVAHETVQKCKIQGYDLLPKTLVYVNAWAIGRDPESWKDPEVFMPERFLGSSIDFRGHDFELIPFGAGRRMCPGMNLGLANMELALANLLYAFDWELPVGVKKEDIDTDTSPGISMHKKNSLYLVVTKFA